jgi:hypothetical protein
MHGLSLTGYQRLKPFGTKTRLLDMDSLEEVRGFYRRRIRIGKTLSITPAFKESALIGADEAADGATWVSRGMFRELDEIEVGKMSVGCIATRFAALFTEILPSSQAYITVAKLLAAF